VLCALLQQMLLEFGPLWLVALAAPAFLYWPQWAGLMSAVGLGGMLAGPAIRRPAIVMGTVIAVMLGSALALTTGDDPIVVITSQVLLAPLGDQLRSVRVAQVVHPRRFVNTPSQSHEGAAAGARIRLPVPRCRASRAVRSAGVSRGSPACLPQTLARATAGAHAESWNVEFNICPPSRAGNTSASSGRPLTCARSSAATFGDSGRVRRLRRVLGSPIRYVLSGCRFHARTAVNVRRRPSSATSATRSAVASPYRRPVANSSSASSW